MEWRSGKLYQAREVHNAHRNSIKGIHSYGRTFATCSDDGSAKLWDTSSLAIISTFYRNHDSIISVAYDDKRLITGSYDHEIRIFDIDSSILKVSTKDHGHEVNCIDAIVNGKYVASSYAEDIMIHALPSGEFRAKFNASMHIFSFSVLGSGNIAVTGEDPNPVKVLEINKQELGPSSMEAAISLVIEDCSLLSKSFIEKIIRSKNIHSASDLFRRHNILLLAIRSNVIKEEDLDRLNGDIWYLEERIYYRVSKLTSESPAMLYPIFRHAEDLGTIRNVFKFRAEH